MFDSGGSSSGGGKRKKALRPPGMGQVLITEMRELDAFHLKRIDASLQVQETPEAEPILLATRAILNDISEQGTAIYVPKALHLGATGKLVLPEPRLIELGIKVIWCQELEQGRNVFAQQTFPFRIGVQFVFQGNGDAEQLRQYCSELSRIYPGRDLTHAPYSAA